MALKSRDARYEQVEAKLKNATAGIVGDRTNSNKSLGASMQSHHGQALAQRTVQIPSSRRTHDQTRPRTAWRSPPANSSCSTKKTLRIRVFVWPEGFSSWMGLPAEKFLLRFGLPLTKTGFRDESSLRQFPRLKISTYRNRPGDRFARSMPKFAKTAASRLGPHMLNRR